MGNCKFIDAKTEITEPLVKYIKSKIRIDLCISCPGYLLFTIIKPQP